MVQRTRVKICGLTSPGDALSAVECGADAIGLVFYSKSTRALTVAQALDVCRSLPAFVTTVGLFVNPAEEEVRAVLEHIHLDCLQFHGEESAAFCASFGVPYIKAIRVRPELDVIEEIAKYATSSAILLDSYDKNFVGGTGIAFDWRIARHCVQEARTKIVLAGGLTTANVAEAIRLVAPYAVDVSSGVESEPGRKSKERMSSFFNEVYSV